MIHTEIEAHFELPNDEKQQTNDGALPHPLRRNSQRRKKIVIEFDNEGNADGPLGDVLMVEGIICY